MSYQDAPGLRWTLLKEILTSPKHYRHRLDTPREDSPALALGRGYHAAVLEPDVFDATAIAAPEEHLTPSGALSTKKATLEWRASLPPDALVLSPAIRDTCLRIRDAVHDHPDAARWLDMARDRERAVYWTETIDGTDVACKAKLDAWCPREGLLWDLKGIGGIAPFSVHRCQREIVSRHYHAQLGYYLRGLEMSGELVRSIGWVCVETRAPFDVCVIEASGDLLQCAREDADKAVIAYAHALGSDYWPGVAPERVVMDPPAWMLGNEDADADELEIEEAA